VAGDKAPRRGRGDSSFHLVERGFGRFARIVRFSTPCDAGRGRAVLEKGELRISLPKVTERRGRAIPIDVKKY
jgi:HSP20 family molecular chaperone IbpA